jgi:hypothetical protein
MVTVTTPVAHPSREYPWVGQHEDTETIVLFISPKTGVCIQDTSDFHKVGYKSDHWDEDSFDPVTVTIIN